MGDNLRALKKAGKTAAVPVAVAFALSSLPLPAFSQMAVRARYAFGAVPVSVSALSPTVAMGGSSTWGVLPGCPGAGAAPRVAPIGVALAVGPAAPSRRMSLAARLAATAGPELDLGRVFDNSSGASPDAVKGILPWKPERPTAHRGYLLQRFSGPRGALPADPADKALAGEVLRFSRRLPGWSSRVSGEFGFSRSDVERAILIARRVLAELKPYVLVNRRVGSIIDFLKNGGGLRSGFESGHFASADGDDEAARAWRGEQERKLFASRRSDQGKHPIYGTVQFADDLLGDPTWGAERFAAPRVNDGILSYGRAALVLRGIENSTTVTPTDSSISAPQDVNPFQGLLAAVVKRMVADQYAFRDLIRLPEDRAAEFLRTYLGSTALTKYTNNVAAYVEAQIHDVDVVPGMVVELRVSLRDEIGAADPAPTQADIDELRRLCEARGIALRVIP